MILIAEISFQPIEQKRSQNKLSTSYCFTMEWKEIIKDSAWVVENLLSKEECEDFMQHAINAGIENKKSAGDVRHRDSTMVAFDNAEIAERVFNRIKSCLPHLIIIDDSCEIRGLGQNREELYGTWRPYGLNSRWRIVCYPGKGHFGPHRDSYRYVDEHHRSFITINGYLTDRPHGFGGATRFLKDSIDLHLNEKDLFTAKEEDVLHSVDADKAGKAVVFFHDLLHDGEPLKEGSPPKWLFRTEVLFERDPSTATQLTSDEQEARKLLKEAEEKEERGHFDEATKLYRRAYRLDNALEFNH